MEEHNVISSTLKRQNRVALDWVPEDIPEEGPRGYLPRISSWLTRCAPCNKTNRCKRATGVRWKRYKRKEIVANQRDRLRSQERKEIPFYTNSHFTPTRGGLERCFVCFMARSLHIYRSKCVCGIVASFERSCGEPPWDRGTKNHPAPIISLARDDLTLGWNHRSFDSFPIGCYCLLTRCARLHSAIKPRLQRID